MNTQAVVLSALRRAAEINHQGGLAIAHVVGDITRHTAVGSWVLAGLVIGGVEGERHTRPLAQFDGAAHVRMLDSERRLPFTPHGTLDLI